MNEERDRLKEAIRDRIWVAGQCRRFVTATELVRELRPDVRDPLRAVKKRIEELRNEGCAIVGLPGGGEKPRMDTDGHGSGFTTKAPRHQENPETRNEMGPGYTWVHEPRGEWGRAVIARFKLDMGSRIRQMRDHLMNLEQCSADEAQTELFGAGVD